MGAKVTRANELLPENQGKSSKKIMLTQNLENGSNYEIGLTFIKWVNILKMVQHFENRLTI